MTLSGLAARNLNRNRLRTLLTAAGVAVAVLAFVLLRTVLWAWSAGSEYAAKDRIVTRDAVSFINSLPKHYVDDIQNNVEGLQQITWANWFGGVYPGHEHEFFACIAIDPAHYFDVYNDLQADPAALEAFRGDKQGAIVGRKLAHQFGWKVGDTVLLKSQIFRGDWQFHIVGLYESLSRSQDPRQFFFRWDYFNDALPAAVQNQVGWIVSRTKLGVAPVSLSQKIDGMFSEKESATLSQDEHAFQASFMAMFSGVLTAMNIVSLVILGIMMLILGNTVAMAVRERTHEYGVMRAIGFLPQHLAGLVVGESAVLGALGAALGMGFALVFVNYGVGPWVEENLGSLGLISFHVQPDLAALAFALAMLLAMVAAVIPAWRAWNLKVVDALRRVA